ncbi:heparinase II/III family protein [Lentzea sp. NPDC102401]|uniref:heparinase II/III domain-containing protein n=1 Tax=Lentzea sp. NPDC102401 TaxID=3364128 RepID=UPI0037F483BD
MTKPVDVSVPPFELGGQRHDYVCPTHGCELRCDGLLSGEFPDDGVSCRHGCRLSTETVRGAWVALAHQAHATRLLGLARSRRAADRSAAAEGLLGYSSLYTAVSECLPEHRDAPAWMLRGRLFRHACDEAVWAVTIARAAHSLYDAGAGAVLEPALDLLDSLERTMRRARDVVVDREDFRSSDTAWFVAAALLCASAAARIRGAVSPRTGLDEPYGVYEHILLTTHADGWQRAGGGHHHASVLHAHLLALEHVATRDVPADVRQRLRKMIDVFHAIRRPRDVIALHDSPYALPSSEHEYGEIDRLLRLRGWEEPRGGGEVVQIFPNAGYAMLRNEHLHAVIGFGSHRGSQGHLDKLSLFLYGTESAWQPDYGQVLRGHRQWSRYYASTSAHPCFSVDGADQAACGGKLVTHTSDSVVVDVSDAYPDVYAMRRVSLRDNCLVDVLTVRAKRLSRITAHLRPDVGLEVQDDSSGVVVTTWAGTQRLRGWHHCAEPGAVFAATPGPSAAFDPVTARTHVNWTVPGTTAAAFYSVYVTAAYGAPLPATPPIDPRCLFGEF